MNMSCAVRKFDGKLFPREADGQGYAKTDVGMQAEARKT